MGDKLLFDLGANVGAYSFARWNTGEFNKIICVDANEVAFAKLEQRFADNPNVFPIFAAVGAEDDKHITFYQTRASVLSTANPDWLNTPGFRFAGSSSSSVVQQTDVISVTIDKLIRLYGVPDLVKVDVEGYEETALKGLTQKVPMLCFEWAEEMNKECGQCVRYLASLGFEEFYVQYNDDYLHQPSEFHAITKFDDSLLHTRKDDWGMVWVR